MNNEALTRRQVNNRYINTVQMLLRRNYERVGKLKFCAPAERDTDVEERAKDVGIKILVRCATTNTTTSATSEGNGEAKTCTTSSGT